MFKNKKIIYIVIAVVIFLIVLAYFFYRKGKKQVTLQYMPGELPGNKESGNITGASNDEIKNLANSLYQDMKGLNWRGHNATIHKNATLLNDSDLIKLYNTFNTTYQKNSAETLTSWLKNETFGYGDTEYGPLLRDRLLKLNCL